MSVDTLAIIDRKSAFFDNLQRAAHHLANSHTISLLRDLPRERIVKSAQHPYFDIDAIVADRPPTQGSLHCRNLVIHVQSHYLTIYHGYKHPFWATDADVCNAFRRACRELALLSGTDRALYVPELGYGTDGSESVDRIIEFMETTYGPQAASLQDLVLRASAATDYWHHGCFYLDDFADLTLK